MAHSPVSKVGPVLVTGGNGFIAYHIIAAILAREPDCEIHSLDINTTRNRHNGVHYHQADISSLPDVQRIMEFAKPVIIFHTATPEYTNVPESSYHRVIVDGTNNLLKAAPKSVKALINTSTSGVINDNKSDMIDCTEDMPILRPPHQERVYCLAKADAEEIIKAANCNADGLLTCSLRPALAFGERDHIALGKMVAVARQGKSRFQMGNGQNPYDFIYVGNLADAHLLAADALLDAWGRPIPEDANARVDGEVFNVTNDDPWLFWDFQRAVSAQMGNPVRPEDIVVIPKWVGLLIGFILDWAVWLLSAGTKESTMTRGGIRFSTLIRTHNTSKIKRALGYRPRVSMQEGLERSVRWFMEHPDEVGA